MPVEHQDTVRAERDRKLLLARDADIAVSAHRVQRRHSLRREAFAHLAKAIPEEKDGVDIGRGREHTRKAVTCTVNIG